MIMILYIRYEIFKSSNQHIIDDLCDCLLRALPSWIDQNLNAEAIKSALEHQIRTNKTLPMD